MSPMMNQDPAFCGAQMLLETCQIVKAYCLKLLKKA